MLCKAGMKLFVTMFFHLEICNTHLQFECLDAQDDYHTQLWKGVVSLPPGAPSDKDLLSHEDDSLADLNTELDSTEPSAIIGEHQKHRTTQMVQIRNILDRLG